MSTGIAKRHSEWGEETIESLKQTVRELEDRCERYDRIIESSPICTKTISLDRELQLMSYAGHNGLKIPDITEFYNKPYPPVGFDDVLSALYDEHFPLALSGKPTSFECPIPDMEGHKEWYITHLIPMYDGDGELEFILATSANITERKNAEFEADKLNKELVKASRAAGMAEVATGVLHNVGNTLNSVFVSAELIQEKLSESKMSKLSSLLELLDAHTDDLATFLEEDPKGVKILPYLKLVTEKAESDREDTLKDAKRLRDRLQHVKVIVEGQQKYAKAKFAIEQCSADSLIEEALSLLDSESEKDEINISITVADDLPNIGVDRHMVTQILVNLLVNAKQALSNVGRPKKEVRVYAGLSDNGHFYIRVEDNGVGVPEENFIQIFQNGFTTKEEGHGFGLHNASNAAKSMGGSLICQRVSHDFGAVFLLELPLQVH